MCSIANQSIDSIAFNMTGEWIALGSCQLGQLLVWEWQSESYVLKQQVHFNAMSCVAYSPDGMYVATGGQDAKVRLGEIGITLFVHRKISKEFRVLNQWFKSLIIKGEMTESFIVHHSEKYDYD